jgi:hypothetical protein
LWLSKGDISVELNGGKLGGVLLEDFNFIPIRYELLREGKVRIIGGRVDEKVPSNEIKTNSDRIQE